MSRWFSHLKLKVLSFGIAMSIAPLALFGWYGLEAARSGQAEIVQAQNRAAAKIVAEDLAQFVHNIITQMQLLSRTLGGDLVRLEDGERERVLYALLRDVPYLEEVAVTDVTGRELVRVSRREVPTGTEQSSWAGTPLWADISRGGAALGPVTLDADGRPLFAVGVPLESRAGALVARATLRGLLANIAAVRGSGNTRIHVLDEAGRLIGDTDFSLVLAGAKAPLPGDERVPYASVTGDPALGVSAPVPGLPWRVVGETTLSAAMAPVRRLALEFGAGALVLMVVVVALSVVFGLQLTVPVEGLEEGARRVGAGDLSVRIPEGGRDELGRLARAFNAMTSRLQAQGAALRDERDRLDTVVSSIGAGLVLIDSEGKVLWVNRTLSEWIPGPLVGRFCWDAVGQPNCAGCAAGCDTTDGERQVEIGGRRRLLRYHTYVLGEGRPDEPARLEVLEDVTERRSMEAMVLQSEKLAAVGQLAAGVAHEINNPLAVISAYAEDLDDRLKDEGAVALERSGELSAYLSQLQVQVRRCKSITMNLLDFARRGSTTPEPVDVGEVARQTAALIGPRARRAGVQVQVGITEGLPLVRATRDQLQQVFLNLFTNSLDSMEQTGSGEIRVSVSEGGGMLRVTVADTGSGMDAATLERAMEPFFTTKPPGRGTGLGLSTCYGIITGLGGRMSLESSPGEGTRVTLDLALWESGQRAILAE